MIKKVILAKYGEIVLKGLNKSTFEDILLKNLANAISPFGEFIIRKAQSTVYITPRNEESDIETAFGKTAKVFGISAVSMANVAEKDMNSIKEVTAKTIENLPFSPKTFKIEAKRSDKKFPLNSPQICVETGEYILNKFPHLQVDVHNPDVAVVVEVRESNAYIHAGKTAGAGGLPLGSSGKGLLLLSGGIDSPVAAYMMAKRGVSLEALHFTSPPYTSGRSLEKVITLCKDLQDYTGRIPLYIVEFAEMQCAIRDHCADEYSTIILRRMMMRIANKLAQKRKLKAIITGESVAQVASQTLDAIKCTDITAEHPVFRPVVGMDKNEIIQTARKIGTYETSILPYEDCCTVFTPKHPKTRPTLEAVEKEESKFDYTTLLEKAKLDCRL